MNCPNCNVYNPANARYCGRCGATLETPHSGPQEGQVGPDPSPEGAPDPYAQEAGPPSGLRPRELKELVAETLAVYRRNFGVMWRIALLANIPLFIAVFPRGNPALVSAITLAALFTGLLASGAGVYAVSRWYLGKRTTALTCYAAALNASLSLLLAGLVFIAAVVAGIVLSFLLIGIPLLVFVTVVWFFYIQVIMVEGKKPIEALMRSLELVRGTWWRVFGIGVAFAALLVASASALALPGVLLSLKYRLAGDLLVTITGVLVTPLVYIGATLVYFDLRVRKENYTLDTLASELGMSEKGPPQGPATP